MARGDHIKVRRLGGLYTHHGIDIGDGTVVHFDGDPFRQIDVQVRRATMEEFLMGGHAITVDYAESTLSAELVVEAALAQVGKSGYHLFKNNCEHFAHSCKLGRAHSVQAKRLARVTLGTAATLVVLISTAALSKSLERRRNSRGSNPTTATS